MRPLALSPLLLAFVIPATAHADDGQAPAPKEPQAAPTPAPKEPARPGFFDPGIRRADRPKNMVLADLGLHVIGLGYQRTVARRFAVQIAADFYAPWTQFKEASTVLGGIVRARGFVYPFGGAPAGLWVSPFAQYGLVSADRTGGRRIGGAWAFGASVGYSILLGRRVAIALGGGAQYHATYVFGGVGGPNFARLAPTLDLNVGYAF